MVNNANTTRYFVIVMPRRSTTPVPALGTRRTGHPMADAAAMVRA